MEARERDHRRVMVQGGRVVVVVVVAIKLEAISYDRNPLPTAHQVSEYNIERDILQHNRLSVCPSGIYRVVGRRCRRGAGSVSSVSRIGRRITMPYIYYRIYSIPFRVPGRPILVYLSH